MDEEIKLDLLSSLCRISSFLIKKEVSGHYEQEIAFTKLNKILDDTKIALKIKENQNNDEKKNLCHFLKPFKFTKKNIPLKTDQILNYLEMGNFKYILGFHIFTKMKNLIIEYSLQIIIILTFYEMFLFIDEDSKNKLKKILIKLKCSEKIVHFLSFDNYKEFIVFIEDKENIEILNRDILKIGKIFVLKKLEENNKLKEKYKTIIKLIKKEKIEDLESQNYRQIIRNVTEAVIFSFNIFKKIIFSFESNNEEKLKNIEIKPLLKKEINYPFLIIEDKNKITINLIIIKKKIEIQNDEKTNNHENKNKEKNLNENYVKKKNSLSLMKNDFFFNKNRNKLKTQFSGINPLHIDIRTGVFSNPKSKTIIKNTLLKNDFFNIDTNEGKRIFFANNDKDYFLPQKDILNEVKKIEVKKIETKNEEKKIEKNNEEIQISQKKKEFSFFLKNQFFLDKLKILFKNNSGKKFKLKKKIEEKKQFFSQEEIKITKLNKRFPSYEEYNNVDFFEDVKTPNKKNPPPIKKNVRRIKII